MTENKRQKTRRGYVARRAQEMGGRLTIRAMSYDAEKLEFTPGSLASFTSNAGCSHHVPCQANGACSKDISPRPYRQKRHGVHEDTGQQGAAGGAAADILFSSHASSFLRNRINDTDCN